LRGKDIGGRRRHIVLLATLGHPTKYMPYRLLIVSLVRHLLVIRHTVEDGPQRTKDTECRSVDRGEDESEDSSRTSVEDENRSNERVTNYDT